MNAVGHVLLPRTHGQLFLSIISTAYHLLSGSRPARLLLNWLIDWLGEWVSDLTSSSTHYRLFQRRVFPVVQGCWPGFYVECSGSGVVVGCDGPWRTDVPSGVHGQSHDRHSVILCLCKPCICTSLSCICLLCHNVRRQGVCCDITSGGVILSQGGAYTPRRSG